MGQDDSAPVPIRLENGPESSELLDCILDLIKNARTRVWLKVAWWNT